MSPPKVSVVIPTYNRSQALRPTIESVLAQAYADWELLLVDDGSTDDTPEVARSYRDPRIRSVRQENRGHAAARNRGLELARGEYLAYLDHDDRWPQEKLQFQVAYLDEHPEVGVVYGRLLYIDEEGTPQSCLRGPEPQGWIFKLLLRDHGCLYTMSLPMMRTALVRQVGGFFHSADTADDLCLWLRLAQITQFGFIPEILVEYTVGNPHQQSGNLSRMHRGHWGCIIRYTGPDSPLSLAERREIRRKWVGVFGNEFRALGWKSLRQGDYRQAWSDYRYAVRISPVFLAQPQFLADLASLSKRSLLAKLGVQSKQ
jgi:glycosyltransferase involved in cell wall biosynthesis